MPCSGCGRKNTEPRPDISEWGPLLWKLLHALSYRTTNDISQLRLLKIKWKFLFDTLPLIIPCLDCRDHVIDYIKTNRIHWQSITTIVQLGEMREWFFNFHNAVNTRLGKSIFPHEDLIPTYSTLDLRATLTDFSSIMKVFVTTMEIPILSWNQWKTNILYLLSIYEV